ncbi:MAG: DMT family transporter [Spirochaetales bacterium]|nr:DMT family transporter [Spirochaetales bacterium]
MSKNLLSYTQLTLGMLFTAAHVVAGKVVTSVFPIYFASGVTLFTSAALFFLYLSLQKSSVPRLDRRSFLLILLQAFAGIFLFRIGILKGLSYTGAMEGGIILSSTPMVIALLSFFLLREALTWRKIIALGLSIGGIMIINLLQVEVAGSKDHILLGSLFLSGAVFGEALFTVLRRIIGQKVRPVTNAAYTALMGALFFLPLMIRDIPQTAAGNFTAADWLILFFYGTAAPMAAFVLWFSGVSGSSGSTAGVFTAILPLGTILLSALFLGETLQGYHTLGTVCIVAGIVLVVRSPVRKRQDR